MFRDHAIKLSRSMTPKKETIDLLNHHVYEVLAELYGEALAGLVYERITTKSHIQDTDMWKISKSNQNA